MPSTLEASSIQVLNSELSSQQLPPNNENPSPHSFYFSTASTTCVPPLVELSSDGAFDLSTNAIPTIQIDNESLSGRSTPPNRKRI